MYNSNQQFSSYSTRCYPLVHHDESETTTKYRHIRPKYVICIFFHLPRSDFYTVGLVISSLFRFITTCVVLFDTPHVITLSKFVVFLSVLMMNNLCSLCFRDVGHHFTYPGFGVQRVLCHFLIRLLFCNFLYFKISFHLIAFHCKVNDASFSCSFSHPKQCDNLRVVFK